MRQAAVNTQSAASARPVRTPYSEEEVSRMLESTTEPPHCLNEGPDCEGQVEYHLNPDRDDFKAFPRCEYHQRIRLEQAAETMRKYPHNPPADFDPSYAGEV